MKAFPRLGVLAAVACAGTLALGVAAPASASVATPAGPGHFSGLVRLPGGHRIHLECRGHGRPTVVLVSGLGDAGDIWDVLAPGVKGTPVLPAVSRFTRVCAYDRPGTQLASTNGPGRSDPVPAPRSALDVVTELQQLLRAAKLRGPYVLAGHSIGGLLARLYASFHPSEVAGLVSIDASTEGYFRLCVPLLGDACFLAGTDELDLPGVVATMQGARISHPLQPMPMIVLEHSRTVLDTAGAPPGWPVEQLQHANEVGQDELSTLVPHTLHWVAARSGHYIQNFQPQIVINAIHRVIAELRPRTVRRRGGASAEPLTTRRGTSLASTSRTIR